MNSEATVQTKLLPLSHLHKALGAKMAGFAGWEVPIYYTSILEEHERVRNYKPIFYDPR